MATPDNRGLNDSDGEKQATIVISSGDKSSEYDLDTDPSVQTGYPPANKENAQDDNTVPPTTEDEYL
ncbi:uncharacterized protein SEPMUDRAFT_121791 [Sphaerulina musiva SO2202]|uniref:Uncharacterized protein n=1 Tax=Sphaerulina musiva (strain SO2202) TaxID=692275 RepID=M3CW10_SPHMS|nr:uncharacterized protein SEPMUDRAFT_121791 [Sphaerulina musiva SO2202]EMF07871.1 hypothetical protein SEPMUDRAFT_121791 [Sphaerulina musiva SO2202]